MDKSKLFRKAWAIAREAQAQFGGTSREYFALALRIAWSEGESKMTKEREEELKYKLNDIEDMISFTQEHLEIEDDPRIVLEMEEKLSNLIKQANEIRSQLGIKEETEQEIIKEIEEKKEKNKQIEAETFVSNETKKFAETLRNGCYVFSSKQASVVKETKKAYLVSFHGDHENEWFPKKSCFIDRHKTVCINEYFVEQKNISIDKAIYYSR